MKVPLLPNNVGKKSGTDNRVTTQRLFGNLNEICDFDRLTKTTVKRMLFDESTKSSNPAAARNKCSNF